MLSFSLDPDDDPLCTLLVMDYYAIKSEEYSYFVQLYNEFEVIRNISMLPNFLYTHALSQFYLGNFEEANAAVSYKVITLVIRIFRKFRSMKFLHVLR